MTGRSFISSIPKNIILTCIFGAFVFLQFTVLGLANHAGEIYLSTEQRELVYYALQVFVILGYLLYSLFFRLCTGKHIRNVVGCIVFGIFFAAVTILLLAGRGSLLYVGVAMAAVLFLGGIGGAVHRRMSMETAAGTDVARCMGFGSAAAVVLQYMLQIRWGVTPVLPFFMLAAYILLAIMLLKGYSEPVPEAGRKPEKTSHNRIFFSVLIAAAFLLFACFYNEYIHHLQIRSNYAVYNVYSWPRLMLVPGYLLFAVIGDRNKGKYVPITSLCIMLVAILNVVLTEISSAFELNMCLFYAAIAAFTSYYLLTFWRLAPGTENIALWAPFGRILDSAMVLLTGAIHLSKLSTPMVLGADIAGVAMVILLMAINGDFNLVEYAAIEPKVRTETVTTGSEKNLSARTQEDALARMREIYHLTPRETEVLRELVLTEDKQTVISERLFIQVKTLQDYVTRLYRKTGAATRAGLTDLYHENRN